jgi:hypothetical protein
MNPTIGGHPPFSSGSNPSLNAPEWSTQPGGQDTSYIPSFTPSSSISIPTKAFVMMNPPLSFGVPPIGSHFHAMGNPRPGAPQVRGNVYNPHYATFVGMVPMQPFMH